MSGQALKRTVWRAGLLVAIVSITAGAWGAAQGQARGYGAGASDPDWPCVQRKVPHISPGTVWSGPPVDEQDRSWEQDSALAALVRKLASRRTPIDEARKQIARFADVIKDKETKNRSLALLFTGILQLINHDRDEILAGIGRYARHQTALAGKIEKERDQYDALNAQDKLDEAGQAKRDKLETQLNWDTRVFEERARSLSYVCETPGLLEQRVFALAREIQAHLDQD